ncbi:MAG TPA: hypothetical protein PK478_05005 [Nitrospira sp.]|jgi:sorbitol-specific phosphotransferase system component IIBC|uniref:hypothetical protein n=1 Tax=Nitrospira sp. ND1 TaxID=1658518 RepID=UPI0009BC6216|nr:hypothetical protein [Nitrospira sp. ND1]MBK7419907.1 hypothetical protein [Nitrospira sp.]OYT24874.1 MAG: hypothetical protein CCU27_01985 [Nitrospira sp. UW-LDO-02]MBK7486866.1 hypothetical protein [Nitrospira sp.]MBK8378316.1 hypothetical protein [Nitrospira sp.]MBK9111473.1 hypothetical protein [Nitrospira sp.]
MKRIVEKKMQARKKSSSKVRRAKQREIEPSTHVIERKPRRASGVATELKKQRAKKTVALTKKASTSRGQAKKVGRAVGKILGRVIGTVEQTVAKVMPGSKPTAARQTPSSGRRKRRS